jgi:hypothetical protein
MKSKIFKLYSEENQTISTQIEKMYSLEEMQEMDQQELNKKVFVSSDVENPDDKITQTQFYMVKQQNFEANK